MDPTTKREHFRLLIVDDLAAIHEDFRKILRPLPGSGELHATAAALFDDAQPSSEALAEFTVDSALQGEEALRLVEGAIGEGNPYALAFVDVRMPPGWDGLETIRRLWAIDQDLQVVLCTAYSDYTWTDTVRSFGLNPNLIILKKPFDNTEVLQLAHALTRKWQLSREHAMRLGELDDLVRQRTDELRRAQEALTQAFAANPHAQSIVSLDDGRILAVNEAFERILGRPASQIIGTAVSAFGHGLDPEKFDALRLELLAGRRVDGHAFTLHLEGRPVRNIRCSARPVTIAGRRCAIWVFEDFTEYLHLETQLRQAQKMEAVGQLAAGIAHDFNNLLTVIQCYSTELLRKPENARNKALLEPILTAAQRAASLTRQLLVFSRRQIVRFEELDPAAVLSGMRPFLGRLIGEHINLVWNFPPSLPAIRGDSAGVEQIVVNLMVNARDAVQPGGTITLKASVREFASVAETRHAQGSPGRYVAIEVADNGCGISPEVLPRIFEPFFTTKDVGKGTGLGLSTVYSLVRQHGGWIDVQSEVGAGTTFTAFLPAVERAVAETTESVAIQPSPETLPKVKILAVEDDVAIQTMLKAIFEKYEVPCTVVRDGASALTEWHCAGPFDLVVSDVVMPGNISGVELARRLRALSPTLPIVFITGYSPEHVADEKIEIPGPPPRIALKPFTVASLSEAMLGVLGPNLPERR